MPTNGEKNNIYCVGLGQSEELLTYISININVAGGRRGLGCGWVKGVGCPCALSFCKQFSYLPRRMLRAANNLVSGQLWTAHTHTHTTIYVYLHTHILNARDHKYVCLSRSFFCVRHFVYFSHVTVKIVCILFCAGIVISLPRPKLGVGLGLGLGLGRRLNVCQIE